MTPNIAKAQALSSWRRLNLGYPLAVLLAIWLLATILVRDNSHPFIAIFGTGDLFLMGFLIVAGVATDSDLLLQRSKTLSNASRTLIRVSETLAYVSIFALVFFVGTKLFSISPKLAAQFSVPLWILMVFSFAGLFACSSAALWAKHLLLKCYS